MLSLWLIVLTFIGFIVWIKVREAREKSKPSAFDAQRDFAPSQPLQQQSLPQQPPSQRKRLPLGMAIFLIVLLLLSGFGLLVYGANRYPLLRIEDVAMTLKWSFGALLLFLLIAPLLFDWNLKRWKKRKDLIFAVILSLVSFPLFGTGLFVTLNGFLDKTEPHDYPAMVVDMGKSGRRAKTSYAIVKFDDQEKKEGEIRITSEEFHTKFIPYKTRLVLTTKPGCFGAEWVVGYRGEI